MEKQIYCPNECMCQWCKGIKREELPCYDPYVDSDEYKEWLEYELNKEIEDIPW